MKTLRSIYAGTCLVAVMALFLGQAQQPRKASLPAGSATVTEYKGEVVLHAAQGVIVPCQRGLVLDAGAMIQTAKGSLLLTLQDGSQVLVEPNSQVILESPDQSGGRYLQQVLGRILAKVQKRMGVTPSFRMGTPTAVISVRGTKFEVSVDRKGKTSVDVYEGLVEVQGLGAWGTPVMVGPSFATEVQPNQAAEPPRESEEIRKRKGLDSNWQGLGGGGAKGTPDGNTPGQSQSPNPTQQDKQDHPDD